MVSLKNYPQTGQALRDAENIAYRYMFSRDGLGRENRVTVHHVHDHWYWGDYGYYRPCYLGHHPSCGRSSRDSAFEMVGVISAIAMFTMVYFVGSAVAECRNVCGSLKRLTTQISLVSEELKEEAPLAKMNIVFAKEKILLDHASENALQSLALKTTFLASATIAFVGSVVHGIALVQTGVLGAAVAGGVMLYRSGYGSTDRLLTEDARALQYAADDARKAFA